MQDKESKKRMENHIQQAQVLGKCKASSNFIFLRETSVKPPWYHSLSYQPKYPVP